MSGKCKIFLIILGLIIVLVGIGVVIYFYISASLTKHGEKCVIRHLHDLGHLQNVTLEQDPRTTDISQCKYSLHYVKGEAKKSVKEMLNNCKIANDKELMDKLEGMAIYSRFLAKLNELSKVSEVKQEMRDIINQKCNGTDTF